MKKLSKLVSAAMAGVLGTAITAAPVLAKGRKPDAPSGNKVEDKAAKNAQGHDLNSCRGKNACRGQGGCAVQGKHSCKGKNACKGQGGCRTEKHSCKGQNACKGMGGCATDKHSCKGQNECRGKGGCSSEMAAPEKK